MRAVAAGGPRRPASSRGRAAASSWRGRAVRPSGPWPASAPCRRRAPGGRRPTGPGTPSRRAPRRPCGSRAVPTPSSSAMPDRMRRSGSEAGLANTASKGRGAALPGDEGAGLVGRPGRPAGRRRPTRVTSVWRCSRLTTKRAASRAARKAAGSLVSSGSTPPTTRPPRSPLTSAATIALPSRPALAGQRVRRPTRRPASTRADASASRTSAGQQVGQAAGLDRAAVTGASRHPGEPGTGALRELERRR